MPAVPTSSRHASSTVRSDIAARVVLAAERCGMPRADLFRLAQREGQQPFWDFPPDSRRTEFLSMSDVFGLWDVVAQKLAARRTLPVLSTAVPLPRLDEFGFLLMSAPNIEESFRCMQRAFSLLTDSGQWRIESNGRSFTLVWNRVPRSVGQCLSNEALIAQVVANISTISAAQLPVLGIKLAHAALDSKCPLSDVTSAPVEYDALETSLTVPRDFLAHKPSQSNPELFEYFGRVTQRLLWQRTASSDLVQRTRRAIERCLDIRELSEGSVAAKLGLSCRTLQRQLAHVGTTYQVERDHVLKTKAESLVRMSNRSLADIADVLSFSEPSAFSHAFRRWFGRSPSQMRRRSLGGREWEDAAGDPPALQRPQSRPDVQGD